MKSIRVNTGGLKEFIYTSDDLNRVRNDKDINEFRKELKEWREHPWKYWIKNKFKRFKLFFR